MAALQNFLDNLKSSLSSDLSTFSVSAARAIASANPVSSVTAAAGAPYSAMYVFGDSLSDTGNVSLATAGLVPVSPPYADRSFSNGPVWAQDLAQSIGLPALKPSLAGGTDFAYGGAETGQTPEHTTNGTDLTSQYDQFAAQVSSPQTGALYAIWIGANDVLDIAGDTSLTAAQQQAVVADAVNNEVSVIDALGARGARNFLVLNVPDLGKTPYETARGTAAAATASSVASMYNSDLASAVQSLQASGIAKFTLVDTFSLLDNVTTQPSAYGFSNATTPVWTGNVSDSNSGTLNATGAAQNQFVYFDSLHPTAQTDTLLASGIASSLTSGSSTGTTGAGVSNDFNGDKKSDILWQNDDSSVSIWTMNGASVLTGGLVTGGESSWHAVGSGDFNGDGRADILWQNDDGSVSIWEMNGTSIVGGGAVSGALSGEHVRGTGDFNGDGKSDVLLQGDSGSVSIWEMSGTSIIGGGLVTGGQPGWHVVGSGDFYGDGRSDILWQNDDGSVSIWEMSGTTVVGGGLVTNGGPGWHVVGSGDFNGDGRSDILWQNDDGSVSIWEMNGTSVIGGGLVTGGEPGWRVRGTGDFNGDGHSDILWQNQDDSVSVWEMNGTSVIGGGLVTGGQSNWHVVGNSGMHFISGASTGTVSAVGQSDEFVFTSFAAGAHAISGFDLKEDVIELSKASFSDFASVQAHSTGSGGGTLITLDPTSTLLVQGIAPTDLHSSNFAFA
jgi:phospholipase/lecithinase/hemolysin